MESALNSWGEVPMHAMLYEVAGGKHEEDRTLLNKHSPLK